MATPPFSCTPPYYLAEGVTVDDLDPSQPVYVVFVGRRPGIHQNLCVSKCYLSLHCL
jgi:hypothetical protein